MQNAHKRKKQPQVVRRALLDQAIALTMRDGLDRVTLQAVAVAAGVTKGGLLHHFANKQALIDAVFDDLLDGLDGKLDALIAADPMPYGAFTRAYVEVTFATEWRAEVNPRASMSVLILSDARMRTLWSQWFAARLARHDSTDAGVALAVVRLAADGFWVAALSDVAQDDTAQLHQTLIAATRPENTP